MLFDLYLVHQSFDGQKSCCRWDASKPVSGDPILSNGEAWPVAISTAQASATVCRNNDVSVGTASTKISTCEAQQWICFSKVADEIVIFFGVLVLRMEIPNQVDHHHHHPKIHNCILSI